MRRLRERGEEEGRGELQISQLRSVEKRFQGGDGVKRSQGLKASSVPFSARLKSCPDTKHQSGDSQKTRVFRSANLQSKNISRKGPRNCRSLRFGRRL
jgi:hypothetical protein